MSRDMKTASSGTPGMRVAAPFADADVAPWAPPVSIAGSGGNLNAGKVGTSTIMPLRAGAGGGDINQAEIMPNPEWGED